MTDESPKPSLSYKDAGVDIDAGNALIEKIKGVAKRTHRPEVMGHASHTTGNIPFEGGLDKSQWIFESLPIALTLQYNSLSKILF